MNYIITKQNDFVTNGKLIKELLWSTFAMKYFLTQILGFKRIGPSWFGFDIYIYIQGENFLHQIVQIWFH